MPETNYQRLLAMLAAIDPNTETCLEWPFALHSGGYGMVWKDGKMRRVHVLAFQLAVNPSPSLPMVCHTCDNPRCFRPSHLFEGSSVDNIMDSVNKKRWNRPKGEQLPSSRLTEAQVREIRDRSSNGESTRSLGKAYGISGHHVSMITRRLKWAHVA